MSYQELKKILQDLQQVTAKPAVSIFVKTHRTFPDNEKDPIALKNQLKLAEEQITQQYDAATAQKIMQLIRQQSRELDFNYNLDTLAIFATPEQARLLRFPFEAKERVVINERFAIRDIQRDLLTALHYYVVVVTREKGRLIEAINNNIVHEFSSEDTATADILPFGTFPMASDNLTATRVDERAGIEDNYVKEFINRIDKNVQVIRAKNELPIIVVGDKRNIGFYREVCDQPHAIIATVDNVIHMDNSHAQHIIDSLQPALKDYQQQRQKQAQQDLQNLHGTARIRTDLQEIYRAALEGNTITLYVAQGCMIYGQLDAEHRTVHLQNEDDAAQQIDIIGELIDRVLASAGKIIFMDQHLMGTHEQVVLETRY
ncbi:hypothetical protein ACF3NA_08785 [Alkanindiges sp. WGS2144]|uniref:AOC03_06830 family ribosome hibernation factor n=1 Tax=Alkanindiges sp. WGS2144 TaxID=3366808 RepID=UPI0037522960